MLAAIAEERQRLASRRGFMTGSAKVVGAGALGLAGLGTGAGLRAALAQDFADDLEVLNYALTLEHLEFAFYRDGLAEFDEDDFEDGVFAELEAIRNHEAAHVEALIVTIGNLGGEPVAEAEYDFGYDDAEGFLAVAMALENTGVAAYAGAAPSIDDQDVLVAALGIHSVEARHAAYLNTLNGETAFPDAVDAALTRNEVLEIAGPFFVGEATEETPAAESEETAEADEEETPEADETPAADAGGGDTAEVAVEDYGFVPAMLEIAVGTTVTFTNNGGVIHTATANDRSFDTGTLGADASATITFDEAGEFPYICLFHEGAMKGTIVVS